MQVAIQRPILKGAFMNTEKKLEIKRRLVGLMIEHNQDILCPLSQELLKTTIALIESYSEQGLFIEIRGATSGLGFFEFDLFLPFKK